VASLGLVVPSNWACIFKEGCSRCPMVGTRGRSPTDSPVSWRLWASKSRSMVWGRHIDYTLYIRVEGSNGVPCHGLAWDPPHWRGGPPVTCSSYAVHSDVFRHYNLFYVTTSSSLVCLTIPGLFESEPISSLPLGLKA
jgi:hypothetical protein